MISNSISKNASSNKRDVLQAKVALKRLGYYELPSYGITPYADSRMFAAISKFQSDHGLKKQEKSKKR